MPNSQMILLAALWTLCAASCRHDEWLPDVEIEQTGQAAQAGQAVVGMYVLNEGNMGTNKCTLDYLDLQPGQDEAHYYRNIYPSRNPHAVLGLGDVGNDVAIWGSRLWVVVNCSNKVEVCTADSARRIGQVDIPNARYLAFDGGYAYVSSYVGPVQLGRVQSGRVYKVDTLTLAKVDSVTVGYQPEEMAVVGGRLYVANSGGYRAPDYDRRVSVIDLTAFRVERMDDVAPNLHRLAADAHGQLWVSSRGDYLGEPSCLCWQTAGEAEWHRLDVAVSSMCLAGDSLYCVGSTWNAVTQRNSVTYSVVNVVTHEVVPTALFDAPEVAAITMPYGIAVSPAGRDFYLMDARSYVTSGELLHFGPDGTFDWRVRTGDIPSRVAFRLASQPSGL